MRGDKRVIDRIKKYSPSNLALSTVTLAEILYGIVKSPMKKKERRLKIKQISVKEILRSHLLPWQTS
jgi:predicted nucleic acid-binding protein